MPSFNTNTNTFGGTNNNTSTTRTMADDILRQLGLTVRYGIEGPAELAGIASDPITETYNLATGSQVPRLGSAVSQLLDRVGLPRPETTTEEIVGVGSKVGAGAGAGGVLGRGVKALARGGTRLLSLDDAKMYPQFAKFITDKPIAQGVGGVGAETALQTASGLGVTNPAALTSIALLGGTVAPPSAATFKRAGGAVREGVGQFKDPRVGIPLNPKETLLGKLALPIPIPSILRATGILPSLRSSAESAVGDFLMQRSTSPTRTIEALKEPIETVTQNPDIRPSGIPVGTATQTTGALAVGRADDIGLGSLEGMVKSMFDEVALNAFERNKVYAQQLDFIREGWLPSGGKTAGQAQVNQNLKSMFKESAKPFFNDILENKKYLDEVGLDDDTVFLRLQNTIDKLSKERGTSYDPEVQASLNKVRKTIRADKYKKAEMSGEAEAPELSQIIQDISDPENLYSIRKTIQDMIEGKLKKEDGMTKYRALALRPIINEIDSIFMETEEVISALYQAQGRKRLPSINPKTNKPYTSNEPEYNTQWNNYRKEYSKNKILEKRFNLVDELLSKGSQMTAGADDYRVISMPFVNSWKKGIKKNSDILSEGQFKTLDNIADDIILANQVNLPFTKTGGSDTFKNISIASVLSRFAGGNMPPEIKGTSSHKLLDALFVDNNEQVKQVLLQAWLDPTFASKLMQKATDRNLQSIGKALLDNATGGAVGGLKATNKEP